MLARVTSCAVIGLEGAIVEVEVDISQGLPGVTIVGLPDAAVNESRERVRSAIRNCGLHWPVTRLTVNLAPADLRKEGPAYDLPIAVGILLASGQAWPDQAENALFVGDPVKACTCSMQMVSRHQKRIPSLALRTGSGPLLDRVDIHIEVPRVDYDKLTDDRLRESSANIRARVERARQVQRQRFAGTSLSCNADTPALAPERPASWTSVGRSAGASVGPAEVREHCRLDEAGRGLVRAAMQQLQMSARAFHRILKLARTIADLAGDSAIQTHHLAEAIQYRPRRRE